MDGGENANKTSRFVQGGVSGYPGQGGRKEELYEGEEREDVPVQTCWSRVRKNHEHLQSQGNAPCFQRPHTRPPPVGAPEEAHMVGSRDVIRPIVS